jgi:HlyD family secretion protein
VGRIRKGQPVRFSVDAFPGEVFAGTVGQIRLNAAMTQNVVTYTVIVETDNRSGKLLPYLTADLQFEIEHRTAALLVSNAALRWQPPPDRIAPQFRAAVGRSSGPSAAPAGTTAVGSAAVPAHEQAVVWTPEGPYVRPIAVRIGSSDGVNTEILSGDVSEGLPLVAGDESPHGESESASPFSPPMFGGGRR